MILFSSLIRLVLYYVLTILEAETVASTTSTNDIDSFKNEANPELFYCCDFTNAFSDLYSLFGFSGSSSLSCESWFISFTDTSFLLLLLSSLIFSSSLSSF